MTQLPAVTAKSRQRAALIVLAAAGILALFVYIWLPSDRPLVRYGLYAIPAHLLISFLPHEPYLFAVAKDFSPKVIASVGVLACSIAIVLDYWLIGWFVSRQLVRETFDQSRAYEIAQRIFRKAPFLLVAGSAFAPVPFYPVKILAIANDYSVVRFVIAMAIGRWPRFLLLAMAGEKVNASNRSLLWIAVALAAFAMFQIWRVRRSRVKSKPN